MLTVGQVADLEVAVQADYRQGDEAAAAEEEADPAVEAAALPAEHPAVGEAGNHEERLAGHYGDRGQRLHQEATSYNHTFDGLQHG